MAEPLSKIKTKLQRELAKSYQKYIKDNKMTVTQEPSRIIFFLSYSNYLSNLIRKSRKNKPNKVPYTHKGKVRIFSVS